MSLGGVCGECVCPVLRAYDSSGFHKTTCTVIIWKKPFRNRRMFLCLTLKFFSRAM